MGNKVSIKGEYWKEINPGGEIEKKYISLGEHIPKKLEIDINDNNAIKYTITYPEKLLSSQNAWPLIIVVNGSNDTTSSHYNFNFHLTSHGFIVVGNEDKAAGSGETTSKMLDYVLNLNKDKSNILYNKIDIQKLELLEDHKVELGV